MSRRRTRQRGMTLIELLLAVTLFGAISASMGIVLSVAFTSMNRIDTKVDFNRRILSSQRTIDQILQGLIPAVTPCAGRPIGMLGRPDGVRFVSSYSLTEGARGRPQIIEIFTDTSANQGYRLLLNERPYFGKPSLSAVCGLPFQVMETSFILADNLGTSKFSYRRRDPANGAEVWFPAWTFNEWPSGIRIDLTPTKLVPNQIQPTTVVAPLFVMNNNTDDPSQVP